MNETEKDASRSCVHNYEYKNTRVSKDETEFVKTWICTECQHECEQRFPRIGSRKEPRVIM
jgi:hypothetical protein